MYPTEVVAITVKIVGLPVLSAYMMGIPVRNHTWAKGVMVEVQGNVMCSMALSCMNYCLSVNHLQAIAL
jgi:hypothetical protein